jgi:tetratricopeptide (TPR) repeat protein
MNIIYVGVSIIALLTATESYAMLCAYDMDLDPHYIGTPSNSQKPFFQLRVEEREGFYPSNEPLYSLVMNNRIYFSSSAFLPPENEILSFCKEALKRPSHTPDELANLYLNYAGALLRTEKCLEALSALKRALDVKNPKKQVVIGGKDRAITYCQLASVLDGEKRPQEATLYYYKALNLKDTRADLLLENLDRAKAFYNVANIHEEQKQYDEAIKAYNEAMGLQDLTGRKLLEEKVPYIISRLKLLSHRVNLHALTERIRKECTNINLKPRVKLQLDQLPNEARVQMLLDFAENSKELNQYGAALEFYKQALMQEDTNGGFVLTDQGIAKVNSLIEEVFAEKKRYEVSSVVREMDFCEKDDKEKTPPLNPRKRTYQTMSTVPQVTPSIMFQKPKDGI